MEQIERIPPSADFVESIREYGQLQSILMCYNDSEGWFLVDGAQRLLAIRSLWEQDNDWKIAVTEALGIYSNDTQIISMIINAQRKDNPLHEFATIKRIMVSDRTATYKSIALQIHKPVTYVKSTFETYGRIPQWALDALVDGKIAETTAIKIGKFTKGIQEECRKEYEENGKLSLKEAANKRRLVQRNIIAKMSPAMGFATSTGKRQQFYPVKVLDELKALLDASKYAQAKKMLEDLLS
jgi:hypothetical protein